MRGPLYKDAYQPQVSGHETFPLRYGWLKKAFDRVAETQAEADNRSACWGDDAIARFGVGKNMVASMRHWAKAAGIIEESATNTVRTTEFGERLFASKGSDPWMEHPATLWLIHWQLAARANKTTWFWAFNHYPAITFDREVLVSKLKRLADERGWNRVALATLRHDVACFIRTYVARQLPARSGGDDVLESPLTELGLIKAVGQKDGFRFVRGPKTTLGNGVFAWALMDFWSHHDPDADTLSFEAIAHAPGGPGRVFVMDENDLVDRLATLDAATRGALRWSETAGLKQLVRNAQINRKTALRWIRDDYRGAGRKAAA